MGARGRKGRERGSRAVACCVKCMRWARVGASGRCVGAGQWCPRASARPGGASRGARRRRGVKCYCHAAARQGRGLPAGGGLKPAGAPHVAAGGAAKTRSVGTGGGARVLPGCQRPRGGALATDKGGDTRWQQGRKHARDPRTRGESGRARGRPAPAAARGRALRVPSHGQTDADLNLNYKRAPATPHQPFCETGEQEQTGEARQERARARARGSQSAGTAAPPPGPGPRERRAGPRAARFWVQ